MTKQLSAFDEEYDATTDVYVCPDWFSKENTGFKFNGFPMNRLLKEQLDYLIKNITNDWDFTLIISGEGEVRIGKSTLAQQIATYWCYELKRLHNKDIPFNIKNLVFNGGELIKQGNAIGSKIPYSPFIFDEAGADLEGAKAMRRTTQDVKDFLRECGQYNMLNILVLPEFFDLPKSIALNRTIALLNVYWLPTSDGIFQRGFFKFYSRKGKKKLYLHGKKELDYHAWGEDFYGRFPKFYTIDEKEYKDAKRRALKNREKLNQKDKRLYSVLYACFKIIRERLGLGIEQLRDAINDKLPDLKISSMFISRFENKMRKHYGEESDIFVDDETDDYEEVEGDNEKVDD